MNPAVNRSPQSPQPKSPEKLVRPTRPEPEPIASTQASERQEAPPAPAPPPEQVAEEPKARQQPIPPPGEPMQYRAIGLVRGQYLPSAEQFTQGMLLADDETLIDSVLLGRVMSLVKNHIDLSQPHLWVVYPRTRKEDDKLHLQIVGVWEPETLDRDKADESSDSDRTEDGEEAIEDGYFSIRGEVVYQSPPDRQIVVKIRQSSRQQSEKAKFFKLHLQCSIGDKMLGRFWDFQVLRQDRDLVVREGKDIGFLPLKKKPKTAFSKRPVDRKPQLPRRDDRPPMPASPSERKPLPKPIKRQGL